MKVRLPIAYTMAFFIFLAVLSSATGKISKSQQKELVVQHYIAFQEALASDNFRAALASAKDLAGASEGELKQLAQTASGTMEIVSLRESFSAISNYLIETLRVSDGLTVVFCPMAFQNRGARWIQKEGPIRNPYFGAKMLTCGRRIDAPR